MPLMAPSRARFDRSRGRATGSIFGSPESQDRASYLDEGMRNYDAEARRGLQINPIQPVFDALKREELGAAYDGKKFGVSGLGNGVTTNRTAMTGGQPMPRARKPVDYLDSGGFDVTDDPRVQQAMTLRALQALDPTINNPEAERGRALQDSVLDENRQDVRGLRRARDFGVPMANLKADVADMESEREARRDTLPYRAGVAERDFNRRRDLAVLPAQIAAEGRERVAGITGDSRVDAANARRPDPIELLIEALSKTDKGTFGVDAEGNPMAAPDDLRQRLREALLNRTTPGAPPSGPPARGGGAGPSTGASGAPPSNPKPGDKYRMPNGKIAVWANDDGTWGWYEDDGG